MSAFVVDALYRTASGIPAGTYIFATHCVEIARNTLTVRNLDALKRFDANPVPGGIQVFLHFPDDIIRLSLDRTSEVERQLSSCASVLRAATLARQRGDQAWLAARDPIGEVEKFGCAKVGYSLPLKTGVRIAVVGSGMALALAATSLRTVASDAAVVRSVQLAPSSVAWRWYISAGGRRASEAESTWLPEALRMEDETAFQAALSAGTSRALRYYMVKFSIHAPEVRESLLPRAALREATATGSIRNLRSYSKEFAAPQFAPFRDEAMQEVSGLYSDALRRLLDQVPDKDLKLRRYFERLFEWLSSSPDGRVDVVFSPPATVDLAKTDQLYRRLYAGKCASVASLETHFGASALSGSQAKVFDGLTNSFKQIVSNEALELVHSDSTNGVRPAILVAYAVSSSGTVFVDEKEPNAESAKECFIGTRIKFDVRMMIPGERTNYSFTVNVLPPDHFEVSDSTASWMPKSSNVGANRVYNVMTGLAFERLAGGLRQRLFDPSSAAYDEMFGLLDSLDSLDALYTVKQ